MRLVLMIGGVARTSDTRRVRDTVGADRCPMLITSAALDEGPRAAAGGEVVGERMPRRPRFPSIPPPGAPPAG